MNILSATTQHYVESSLIKQGLITQAQLHDFQKEAEKNNKPLMSLLLEKGHITDEQLTKALAHANNVPYVNLTNVKIESRILSLLPKETAQHYMAVPLGEMQNRLVVAMLDADNIQAVDFLSNKIGRPIKVYAASESGIKGVLGQYDQTLSSGVQAILEPVEDQEVALHGAAQEEFRVETLVQDSPISKILASIMDYAAENKASDIHIEPYEKDIKVRCRIDGVLREMMKLPKSAEAALVSRVKILATLKIDEHRIPQDGQFTINSGGKAIDLRIAISPVVWGEQIVIRLLDKTGTSLKLEEMGYMGKALHTVLKGIDRPNGMILTSGPTGSGKTTSLYALINQIKNESINIVTLEDPVEYKMEGVNQIQVNADVGLTFASGLRSILRQDPDVVMVGEIRDKETATLAVQAALTGHLVFSTLHTNSAAGILPRLLDMGIEPFLIASTVHTVISQRLVRRVIEGGERYESDKAETEAIHSVLGDILPKNEEEAHKLAEQYGYKTLPLADKNAYTLTKGKSTPANPTGYQGRMGIYEVFEVDSHIQDLILKRSPSSAIEKAAQDHQGMLTMRQDGYLKALDGRTTISEVDRVATSENESEAES